MLTIKDLENDQHVVFANSTTVCARCLEELLNENRDKDIDDMNHVIAKQKLAGRLYGQEVFKVKNDMYICKDHIDKLYNYLHRNDGVDH